MNKLLLLFAFTGMMLSLNAQTDLIISEYVEGWSNNKALEIFNPTNAEIQLSNYRVTRYSNGTDVPPADNQWKIDLPDFKLQPYKSYVIVLDKRDPAGEGQEAPVWIQLQERADAFLCPVYNTSKAMYFNGDDAVALEKTDGTLVDLFARWGAPVPADALIGGSDKIDGCWTDTPPHFTGEGVGITADHTMIKKSSIKDGITTNPTIWDPLAEFDTLPANTFSHLGWHKFDNAPENKTPVFDKSSYKFAIASTSENETVLGTLSVTDNEGDAVKYFIEYGNFIYIGEGDAAVRVEPFTLGKTDGVLKLVDKTGLAPTVLDTFNIKVVATDGFSQTNEILVQILVDGEVGVNDFQVKNKVSIYPNPTNNNIFNVSANKEIAEIAVVNVIGQEIYSAKQVFSYTLPIELNDATKGIYIVRLTMTDLSQTSVKVVLE